jgi:hypothetical protein
MGTFAQIVEGLAEGCPVALRVPSVGTARPLPIFCPTGTSSSMTWTPWHLLIVAISGWMNREQQQVIDYLRERNRTICGKLAFRADDWPTKPRTAKAFSGRFALRATERNQETHPLPFSDPSSAPISRGTEPLAL